MADDKAYGLLINYEFCTGCHSCEVSCQMEHGLAGRPLGNQDTEDRTLADRR